MAAAIGIDLGGTKIEAIVLDAHGAERWRERVPTPADDYGATIDALAALARRAEREAGVGGATVGIGTPGSLTPEGVLKNANSVVLNGRPFRRDLEAALGREVRTANDANCLALSEATDGAGAGAGVVFAAILGTGVGGGIVVNGQVLAGPNGLAGEWGHNPLPWPAEGEVPRACFCGQRGCIETWLAGPSLARDHAEATGETLAPREINARASAGDQAAEATLARYEGRLARALAHVINFLDPDVIVLAGGVSLLDRLYTNVPLRWSAHVASGGVKAEVRTRLARALHGDSSGVRGAAWLWRTRALAVS